MANIGEEIGPPWDEPAPQEWELPGYPVPTTEPAEQPATPEPVTIPAGTLRPGDRIRITHRGMYVADEAWLRWRLLGTTTTDGITWTQVGT